MAFVDTQYLPLIKATKPFRDAAGIEDFEENSPSVLSQSEALLYQLRKENRDSRFRTRKEADDFLKLIEPKKAQALQKNADNMFRTAKLLAEGSTIKLQSTEETVLHTVSPGQFQFAYSANPQLTAVELKRKVEMDERGWIFAERAEKRNLEDRKRKKTLQDVEIAFGVGAGFNVVAGAVTALVPVSSSGFLLALSFEASCWVSLVFGLSVTGIAVVLLAGVFVLGDKEVRKEIPNVFADFGRLAKNLAS